MSFKGEIAEKALVSSGRCCCICHKFCGTKIELHHIKQQADGGEDSFDNCIPLCFDCHADVKAYNPKHPKGRSYSESELKTHRDSWYAIVQKTPSFVKDEVQQNLDKELFLKFVDLLNKNGFMDFVQNNNFAGFSFYYIKLEAMDEICFKWNKPEYEFLDSDLESCRANLYTYICKFSSKIATNTFPCGNNCGSVPEEWEDEQPERFKQVVKELHDNADQIVREYASLIHIGKVKLGICSINDK